MSPCMHLSSRFAQSAVFLLAGEILYAYPAVAADPKPPEPNPADPVNYIEWLNETFGGDIEDNAYDEYQKAYERLEPFDGDWAPALDGPWSDNEDLSDWLAANRRSLAKFREASRKGDCFLSLEPREPSGDPRMDPCLVFAALPTLKAHGNAVKGLIAEGYRAWANGDQTRLPEHCIVVLRSAHHLDNSPTLVGRLVGISCAAKAYRALRQALQLSDDPAALAEQILPELDRADPALPPFAEACGFERLMSWDLCQRLFVPAKRGTWILHPPAVKGVAQMGLPGVSRNNLKRMAEIGFDETLREIDTYFEALERWSDTPYHLAAERADRLDRMVAESENPFIRTFLASLTRPRTLHEKLTADRRATHLITHLLAYRAEHDRFPRKFSQLDLPDLDKLRIDPFRGRDFVYRRKGETFTLYSVAENLKDDGGRHDEKWAHGDFVFWPVQD